MPDPAPTQPNPSGDPSGSGTPPPADPAAGGTPPAATPPASSDPAFVPENLTQEQINQILEKNPLIWKADRIAELREKAGKFTKLTEDQQKASDQKLKDEKKFEELSTQQATTIEGLQKQLRDGAINQQLTNKLMPLGVVDLEAALALADKAKITVAEDGTISGVDEVIEALKTDKAYLFNAAGTPPSVGSPSNPSNEGGSGGVAKFKRSQLSDQKFYAENREAILKAAAAGEIEDDLS